MLSIFSTSVHLLCPKFPPVGSNQLSVISDQLSVISYQLSVISYQLSAISEQGYREKKADG
ncbi:hypothetical protein MYAER_1758 [Microcystis aeruginosa NIES-2549]|uniref:Uncharacterized protein n=1 Tax=Microcystis aeruginosa NIES-2549 TaxID=1641812 RepID=A0A0F6RL65_MICAE|nr:hypothetical protein MYAER_1758 [Microcystis aeruginosa NIES-2549]AOC52502.1 hypothetical protein amyaer_1777 [Microcystis aeruginosa NIES-2481]